MKTTAYNEKELADAANLLAFRSGLQGQDREDCEQDIALAMWVAGQKVNDSGNAKAYQFTTGRGIALNKFNKTLDHNRRFINIINKPIGESDGESIEFGDTLASKDKGFIASTIETERETAIANAIDTLPEREALIARSHLLNGETLTAIAKANGWNVQRTHQLLDTAKENLAGKLASWECTLA